jgi:hypothetical protein
MINELDGTATPPAWRQSIPSPILWPARPGPQPGGPGQKGPGGWRNTKTRRHGCTAGRPPRRMRFSPMERPILQPAVIAGITAAPPAATSIIPLRGRCDLRRRSSTIALLIPLAAKNGRPIDTGFSRFDSIDEQLYSSCGLGGAAYLSRRPVFFWWPPDHPAALSPLPNPVFIAKTWPGRPEPRSDSPGAVSSRFRGLAGLLGCLLPKPGADVIIPRPGPGLACRP